jgi:hypothetical protein
LSDSFKYIIICIDAGVYDEGFRVRQSDWTDVAADNMVFILPIILFTQIAIALLYIKKNAWTKERLELWREKQEE